MLIDRRLPILTPLVLLAALTLAGCKRSESVAVETAKPAAWTLDESKLTQPVRFSASELDPAAGACSDFAGYANAKWQAANPIPSDQSAWGPAAILWQRSLQIQRQLAEHAATLATPSPVERIVADFWVSGMDESGIEAQGLAPLESRLADIDGLADGPAVAEYLRRAAGTGWTPLFSFGPEADFKNSRVNIAYAMQGGLGLPDKTYYFDDDKAAIRTAYEAHIARVLEMSGVAGDAAAKQAGTVLEFETRLARVSKSEEDLSRDVELYYNPVTPAAADALAPAFPWTRFFESQQLAAPAMFSLAVPDFHREVSQMLSDVPVQQWKSYLRYHLVDDASPYLGAAFVAEHFDFHDRTLQGQKEPKPRWKSVLGTINDNAGEALGELYVAVAFPPSSKAQMEALVGNLSQALKARIENLSWMSDETKARALAKWATFRPKIGYPEKWRDWSGLATQRASFVDNFYAARAFNYRWQLGKIGQPVDVTEWGMTPQEVNAYYNPLQNEIVFPAGILQPPYFDPSADDAFNYGAIGGVIGHELTHGYDDQGSRFGATGNFEQWWTREDAARFAALTSRLVEQYDGYDAMPGLKVNGSLTLGENIADLGGLSVAYDALQAASAGQADPMIDGLTRDQRFFLGWATVWRTQRTPEQQRVRVASDPHAPSHIRAIAPPTNVPAFARAFDCKAGDPMLHSGDQLVLIW